MSEAGRKVASSGESALISWSIPWHAGSLVPFLYHARGAPRIYWGSSREDIGFAGYGVAALLTASGPKRFARIQEKSERLFSNLILIGVDRPESLLPRLFGGFGFEPDADPLSLWSGFGSASFALPRFLLTRYRKDIWLTVNHQLRPEDDISEIIWLFTDQVEDFRRELEESTLDGSRSGLHENGISQALLPPLPEWTLGVEKALDRIRAGKLEKVVLARGLQVQGRIDVDPAQALMRLGEKYPQCYRFLYEPVSGRAFFGATPELLVRVSGLEAETVGLAGSAARGPTPELDTRIAEELYASHNERQEHALVVDAIVRQLKPFARRITAPETPEVRKLENIQHLQTPIKVELRNPIGVLPLVEALHPTPAVGGVPQKTALKLIRQIEPISRGWYASPMGWIDHHGDGLFTVAIRSAVSVGSEAMLYAGAGIVEESDPLGEWEETGLKFRPILESLGVIEDSNGS